MRKLGFPPCCLRVQQLGMADVWAALEAAEREPAAKPAAKGKGAGAGQQAPSSTDHVFGLLDVGLNGAVEVELRPATYKPPLPPLTDIVRLLLYIASLILCRAPTPSFPLKKTPSYLFANTTLTYVPSS